MYGTSGKYTNGLKNFINILYKLCKRSISWQIDYPHHILQIDNNSCGVFVCFYAHQILNNGSSIHPFSTTVVL